MGLYDEYPDFGAGPPGPDGIPTNVRAIVYIVILIFAFVTATAFGCIRLYTKAFITHALGWDDYTCLITMLLNVVWTVANIGLAENGLGEHYSEYHRTYGSLSVYDHYGFVANTVYFTTIMFVKLSILFLYIRTFTESRLFRRTVQALMVLIVVTHVTFIFILRFQLRQTRCHWSFFETDEEYELYCHRGIPWEVVRGFIIFISVLTVVLDFIIIALPCQSIWRLQLPKPQKLAILITILSGLVVTVTSILRLAYLIRRFWYVDDELYTEWQVNLCSTIEINLALVCICLPVLKAFTRRFFPRLLQLGSSTKRSEYANGQSRRSKSTPMSAIKSSRKRNADSHEEDLVSHAGGPGYLELGEDGKSDQNIAMNVIEVKTAIDIESRSGV